MVSPQLLDALSESVTSGTFIDTKFYVFSRREVSGRVGSPRPLYCNGHALNTVPYFSTLFSEGFSEAQTKDINEGFPSDTLDHIDDYDYFSDSDLEDGPSCFREEDGRLGGDDGPELRCGSQNSDSRVPPPTTPGNPSQSSHDLSQIENHHTRHSSSVRMGKVAIIRDIAAVTFEAMIHYLYTGEVTFAPFYSDPCHEIPAEARTGGRNAEKPPSPSAKSVYRLADKYDIPTLKERAKAHIYENLAHCNIVDEVFSSFSFFFPEILSVQILQLVTKIKEESTEGNEGETRTQLREKLASLSQPQLERARGALSMIWNGLIGPFDTPVPRLEPRSYENCTLTHRVQLALLRSISTGVFIDVQFYAYNAVHNDSPVDLKPLFTSSIVIAERAAVIAAQTVGIESGTACLVDGLTDDYECWYDDHPGALHQAKAVTKHKNASATVEIREAVILMSGAWRTWRSYFSCFYTSRMPYTPLQSSITGGDSAADAKTQQRPTCSPRSMYSLGTLLGVENVKEHALKNIQSKLTASNIIQELFTLFASNHEAVMDMEIEFLHRNFSEKNPKLLKEHIRKMACGEAPFFSRTLSLVYDKLIEASPTRPATSGSDLEKSSGIGSQGTVEPDPTPTPEPASRVLLQCWQCHSPAMLRDLYDGLRCPVCPPRTASKGRPFMQCPRCDIVRGAPKDHCVRRSCLVGFV